MDKLPIEIIQIIIEYENKSMIDLTSLNKMMYNNRKYISLDFDYNKLKKFETNFQIKSLYDVNELPLKNIKNEIFKIIFFKLFDDKINGLPKNVTHVTFGFYFNQKVDDLPNDITHLTFGHYFNQTVDKLPKNITNLTFEGDYNRKTEKLPQSVIHLTFGYRFNQKVNNLP